MGFSMSFNKLNKVMAVATVLATVSCLAPESAQAGILKFSGSPNGEVASLDFYLDTSVPDSTIINGLDINPNLGMFTSAIKEAIYYCKMVDEGEGCNEVGEKFIFSSGKLISSRISADKVQYNVELKDDNSNILKILIEINSSDSSLINSLTNSLLPLSQFLLDIKEFERIEASLNKSSPLSGGGFGNTFNVTQVPDPNATNSLLGIGALGTVLLIKRTRRSRKFQESQKSAVGTQEVV